MSNKKTKFLLALVACLAIASFIKINTFKAVADEYYSFSCAANQYEVSYIRDDGNFDKVECYNDFASAEKKMKELGGDHVARSANSLSPTKIVSMNGGFAYSYPARGNGSTMNIYEHPSNYDIYHKQTYITNHWEMNYIATERVLKDGQLGMVQVSMNGFEGYVDLENTDLVPYKYVDKQIPIYLGGNDKTPENEQPFKVIPRQKYYMAVQNGKYVDLVLTYHQMYPKKNSLEPVTYTSNIGPAPSFMKQGEKYYSSDGIHYYSDTRLQNYVGTDYSYYQYLPLRSKTNITAPQLEAYLKNTIKDKTSKMTNEAQNFIDAQNTYGCNALLVYALACHESANGTSNFAMDRNNLFGWNAFDSNPNSASSFSSIKQAVNEQMGINLRGFIDVYDGRFFNSSLGNKGSGMNVKYASDPYWGVKIAAIAYNIDKFANSYNGNLSDFDKYDLALINEFDIPVKANYASQSKTLYTTGYGGSYQKDFIVITLGETGNYTKIQSTNAIDEKGNVLTHRTPATTGSINPASNYNFDTSVAYVETKHLQALNYDQEVVLGNYVGTLDTFAWSDNKLHLVGESYVENFKLIDNDNAKIIFELIGENGNYAFELAHQVANDYELSFDDLVDLSEVPCETYTMRISTEYTGSDADYSFDVKDMTLLSSKTINSKLYTFLIKNSLNTLTISEVQDKTNSIRQSTNNISIVDGQLHIEGIGLIEGVNILNQEDIEHYLVFVDKNDASKRYEILMDSVDAGKFSLNDGYEYKYAKFVGDVDLSTLPLGSYNVRLKIVSSSIEKESILFTTNRKNELIVDKSSDITYKMAINEKYSYRFELDIMKNDLDFSTIKKPTLRNSLFGFNSIKQNGSDIVFKGYGMMYKTDYPQGNNNYHKVYLIDQNGKLVNADTKSYTCEVDYASVIGTNNDIDNMCFNSSVSLESLDVGRYVIYLQIDSANYHDIIEFTNNSKRKIESIKANGKTYTFYTSDVRNRIELEVTENN